MNAIVTHETLEPQPQARKHTYHKTYTDMRMTRKQETSADVPAKRKISEETRSAISGDAHHIPT